MKSYSDSIALKSTQPIEFLDITPKVREIIKSSGIKTGICTVFNTHTTAGISINERESGLLKDATDMLEEVVPPHAGYRHDEAERHRPNAHSHLQSMLVGASETIPIDNGKLLLGSYQSIFLVETDGPRARDVIVQIIGE